MVERDELSAALSPLSTFVNARFLRMCFPSPTSIKYSHPMHHRLLPGLVTLLVLVGIQA